MNMLSDGAVNVVVKEIRALSALPAGAPIR